MKKLIVVFALLAMIFMPQMGLADTVKVDWGNFQNNHGGEFAITGDYGAFQTFCLEAGETVNIPGTYTAVLNYGAVAGGGGAVDGIDPISAGTQYLWTEFLRGSAGDLATYFTVGDRRTNAGELQFLFWYLEDEYTYLPAGSGYAYTSNSYWATLNSQFASIDAAKANASGYNFIVLNLTDANGANRQDILVPTPIPGALWLLGSGLLGLVAVRRRKK